MCPTCPPHQSQHTCLIGGNSPIPLPKIRPRIDLNQDHTFLGPFTPPHPASLLPSQSFSEQNFLNKSDTLTTLSQPLLV